MADYHCGICMTPLDIWRPFETYQGRCCELYSECFDLVWDFEERPGGYPEIELYAGFLEIASSYPDIQDPKATFKEIVKTMVDTGVISKMTSLEA